MCPNCGDSLPVNNFSLQYTYSNNCTPSPSDCGSCLDSKCSFYSGPNLSCSSILTNDSLEIALQKIDTKLCAVIGDYSTYNMHCLPTYYSQAINTQQKFVDAITGYTCGINTSLVLFTGTTFPAYQTIVDTRFTALEVPSITCSIASVAPTDTLQTVLNKYCTLLTSISSSISLSGVSWNSCATVTSTPVTVADGFNLLISQICSIQGSTSSLPVFNNTGSCLPSPGAADTLVSTVGKIITRLCQSPTFDINSLTWGCIAKPSIITTDLQTAFQSVLTNITTLNNNSITAFSSDFVVTQTNSGDACGGKTIALATPINQDKYVAATSTDTTPGTLQAKLYAGAGINIDYITNAGKATISSTGLINVASTTSINMVGTGISASPLAPTLKISASGGNTAIINSDGLYVPTVAAPTVSYVETNTTLPHFSLNTLTLDVKIDSAQTDNILTQSTNGLYVPRQSAAALTILGGSTNTITTISTAGTNNFTVVGNVKISSTSTNNFLGSTTDGMYARVSATSGNIISINSDGIYAAASGGTTYTANNGLTLTGSNFQLGGPLVQNTTIDSTSHQIVITNNPTLLIGSTTPINNEVLSVQATSSNVKGYAVQVQNQYNTFAATPSVGLGASIVLNPATDITDSFVNGPRSGAYNSFIISGIGNISLNSNIKNGYFGVYGLTLKSGAGNVSGNSIGGGIFGNFLSDTGNVSDMASVKIIGPSSFTPSTAYTGTITNYYGIKIEDIAASDYAARVTNKYAIFQLGTTDINQFNGEIRIGNVSSASTTNTVTNKIRMVVGGVTYYLLASTSST